MRVAHLAKAASCALAVAVGSLIAAPAQAALIAFVGFHDSATDAPSTAAATAGFTRAPDVGYTDLLKANGHTVTRIRTSGNPDAALLNTFDLVIISRSLPSGDYDSDAETAAWNGITAPTMILGGYILRSNRLGYTTGTTIPDTVGSVRLTAVDPSHPIFDGIALDAGNMMVNTYAEPVTFNSIVQRGISVNTNPLAGGGTLLATTPVGSPAVSGMIIGEWKAGSVMATSPADTLGGDRLVFLTGSRENSITTEGAGIMDLTPDGQRMFLNAVNYMVPEPSSLGLLAFGSLALVIRRRKA